MCVNKAQHNNSTSKYINGHLKMTNVLCVIDYLMLKMLNWLVISKQMQIKTSASFKFSGIILSLGCTAAELFMGSVLYPGSSKHEMIWRITQTQGQLPRYFFNVGFKRSQFSRVCNFWIWDQFLGTHYIQVSYDWLCVKVLGWPEDMNTQRGPAASFYHNVPPKDLLIPAPM